MEGVEGLGSSCSAAPPAPQKQQQQIRVVRRPRCEKFLPELPNYSVYVCGGCGTTLQVAIQRRSQVKELGIYFVDCPQIAKTVEVYFQNLWTLSTLNSTIWTKVAWDKQRQAFRKVPCWSHFLHPKQRCRQYAQRSRVRKLQYIAELERKVQALQSEGIEVSAEMEFLTQQNIMLGMENKTLKQRLESLTQEQLIKHFQ